MNNNNINIMIKRSSLKKKSKIMFSIKNLKIISPAAVKSFIMRIVCCTADEVRVDGRWVSFGVGAREVNEKQEKINNNFKLKFSSVSASTLHSPYSYHLGMPTLSLRSQRNRK